MMMMERWRTSAADVSTGAATDRMTLVTDVCHADTRPAFRSSQVQVSSGVNQLLNIRRVHLKHNATVCINLESLFVSASENTYIVSGGALNSTHSLTHRYLFLLLAVMHIIIFVWRAQSRRLKTPKRKKYTQFLFRFLFTSSDRCR